jgi:uncharacterized protein YfdQ (DUF2303 family)
MGAITSQNLEATGGDVSAVIDFVKQHYGTDVRTLSSLQAGVPNVPVIIAPKGMDVHDLAGKVKNWRDTFAERPVRRIGVAVLQDLDSLIAHANRFKDSATVVFADATREKPSILVVYDYNEAVQDGAGAIVADAKPRFGQHRARYAFPLSEQWKAWMEQDEVVMGHHDFAAWMEDHITDVVPPPTSLVARQTNIDTGAPREGAAGDFGKKTADEELADLLLMLGAQITGPSGLLSLSKGLNAITEIKAASQIDLQGGAHGLQLIEEHKDGTTNQKLQVPGLFLLGIPVFQGGPAYRLAVRLRYRIPGGLRWWFQVLNPEKVFDHAFKEACVRAGSETGLPVYLGAPEA